MDNVKPIWRRSLRLGLLAVLAAAAALRLWRLSQNGFGNEYYTAGVRSMSLSWHNFFYNAFDPAGFISRGQAAGCALDPGRERQALRLSRAQRADPPGSRGRRRGRPSLPPGSAPLRPCRRRARRALPRAHAGQRGDRSLEQHRQLPGAGPSPGGLGADPRGRKGPLAAARAGDGAGRSRVQREDAGRLRRAPDLRAGLFRWRAPRLVASDRPPRCGGSRPGRGVAELGARLRSDAAGPAAVRRHQRQELDARARGRPLRRGAIRSGTRVQERRDRRGGSATRALHDGGGERRESCARDEESRKAAAGARQRAP